MRTTRRAQIGSVQLDKIDDRIIIQSIEPQAGKDQRTTVALWGGSGSRITGEHREYLEVQIKFSINIKPGNYEERSEVLEAVNAWAAAGGWLRISPKPGRWIRVIGETLAPDGDALGWTNRFTLGLRAYGVPYWQDTEATTLTVKNTGSCSRSFAVPGKAKTVLEIEFKNTSSATTNTLTISAGNSSISFEDLGLAKNETLYINHNDTGRQCLLRCYIRDAAGNYKSSVLNKRTGSSSDDLDVSAGEVAVKLSAQRSGNLTVSCRGRYY